MRAAILEDPDNLPSRVLNVVIGDPANFPGAVDGTGGNKNDMWDGSKFYRFSPVLPKLELSGLSVDDTSDTADVSGSEWVFHEGSTVSGTVKLTDSDGNTVDKSGTYKMPLIASDERERIVLISLSNGSGSFAVTINESGKWFLDKNNINRDLPKSEHMEIEPITVYVGV